MSNSYKQPYNLRNKIMIQKKIESTGPFTPLDEFEDYKSIYSDVRYLKGRNFYNARAANIKTDIEFTIRYREDLDETMRVSHKGKFYNIEGLIPLDNQKAFMRISAYEIKHDM